jgi:hypothetical protein
MDPMQNGLKRRGRGLQGNLARRVAQVKGALGAGYLVGRDFAKCSIPSCLYTSRYRANAV